MKENQKVFTTGEVAKLCKISVRTVQFYDKQGIVTPSEFSEGGRRIYSKADLDRFRLACLYKDLGFSLNKIRDIIASGNEHELLLGLLDDQQKKVEEQITMLSKTKDRISAMKEEIGQNGMANISSEDELSDLISKRNKHRKTDIMTLIFLGCFVAVTITGFLLSIQIGGAYPFVMAGVTIALLLALVYYHSSVNAYVCPNCGKKFVIGFFKDMFSPNGVKKGKLIKCPECKKRAWMSDTFRDE